ncbi:type II secretion system protein N [uncultured Algimonas sp.]|uniref:type II secretion system protein N n=1 Tax=uncultured Algimonas sp. TaxID=1547920 RepID=UPI002637FF9B|nr:type II secretion system protein N [uncultured Algimonas sp.]
MRLLLIVAALLAGLASLVRHFPLAWAGAAVPENVATLSGTVWNGQAHDLPLLGTVAVKGVLGGIRLETPPGEVNLSGTIGPGGVDDLVLSMPVARLPTTDARLAGLSGRVSLRIDEAEIADGHCLSATGTAATDVLAVNGGQFGWAGPSLDGPVDCADGRLRLRLSGTDGGETVSATIITGLDGVYQTDMRVITGDAAAGNALSLFGFVPADDGTFNLSEQGRWR